MSSTKIAYMAFSTISELSFALMALLAPIYVTPGYYWWSGIFLILLLAASSGGTKRMNSWGDLGEVE